MKRALLVTIASTIPFCALWAQINSNKIAPLPVSVGKLKKCPVHGTTLQLGKAIILYGKRNEIIFDRAAIKRLFPQANTHFLGGCVVKHDSPRWQAVKFCPQCRVGEERWLTSHHLIIPSS